MTSFQSIERLLIVLLVISPILECPADFDSSPEITLALKEEISKPTPESPAHDKADGTAKSLNWVIGIALAIFGSIIMAGFFAKWLPFICRRIRTHLRKPTR